MSAFINFLKKKILTLTHLYDLFMLLGNFVFAGAIGDQLNIYINGEGSTSSPGIAVFYSCAFLLFIAGSIIFMKPLKHCSTMTRIPKPQFTNGDQAAMVFTVVILGLAVAGAAVTLTKVQMDTFSAPAVLILFGAFVLGCGLFCFLFSRSMTIAGTGKGMNRTAYFILLFVGFIFMYPFVIGIFGPINAIAAGFDIRLDEIPPTGIVDLFLKAFFRALLVSIVAWMLVFIIRKISSAPFGTKSNAGIFLIELVVINTVIILLKYYNIQFSF